jgi:hypothetical protein
MLRERSPNPEPPFPVGQFVTLVPRDAHYAWCNEAWQEVGRCRFPEWRGSVTW